MMVLGTLLKWARCMVGAALFLAGSVAWAHFPIGDCKHVDKSTIQCTGGFSDGGNAPGLTLDVISYDEEILVSKKLDSHSMATFKKPSVPFYILFDAGAGHVVEIDHAEVKF